MTDNILSSMLYSMDFKSQLFSSATITILDSIGVEIDLPVIRHPAMYLQRIGSTGRMHSLHFSLPYL